MKILILIMKSNVRYWEILVMKIIIMKNNENDNNNNEILIVMIMWVIMKW